MPVRYWQFYFAMCFTSPMAPRHATFDITIPVEASRPLFYDRYFIPFIFLLYYINLLTFVIQQPIDLLQAHDSEADAFVPGSMSGDDLDCGSADRKRIG